MQPILSLKNIIKDFPGVRALDNASINVYKGKVMGLVGENGAGKSTILKIFTGIHQPNKGDYFINGEKIKLNGILDAQKHGISIVHQELEMMLDLTVLENIFAGRELRTIFGTYDWAKMRQIANRLLRDIDVDFSADDKTGNLSIGRRQMIEIAKATLTNAKVICLDEPTSSLTSKEINALFKIINRLKNKGVSFIYVSHRMDEIPKICDDITVFRDGKFIIEKNMKEFSEAEIVKHIVGRDLLQQFPRVKVKRGQKVLEVKDWFALNVQNVSFEAYNGEILGFFGLMGAGRTELFKSIIGFNKKINGILKVYGQNKIYLNPKSAIDDSIFYLSEDRKGEGLILNFSHCENISLSSIKDFTFYNLPIINHAKEIEHGEKVIVDHRIKVANLKEKTSSLSGGNQQKVAIAKALTTKPQILIFDEPTRGIDVGAKLEIYKMLNKLKQQNKCIIMISSEIEEIIGMSDRINIMADGQIIDKFEFPNFDRKTIIQEIISHSISKI